MIVKITMLVLAFVLTSIGGGTFLILTNSDLVEKIKERANFESYDEDNKVRFLQSILRLVGLSLIVTLAGVVVSIHVAFM